MEIIPLIDPACATNNTSCLNFKISFKNLFSLFRKFLFDSPFGTLYSIRFSCHFSISLFSIVDINFISQSPRSSSLILGSILKDTFSAVASFTHLFNGLEITKVFLRFIPSPSIFFFIIATSFIKLDETSTSVCP